MPQALKGHIGRIASHPVARRAVLLAGLSALAACQVIPKGPPAPPPPPRETGPSEGQLPTDLARHRVALLVPLSGGNAAVGQAVANAATMAILDTGAKDIRITTYDTSAGAGGAARRAVADGNKLILGPLVSDDVVSVAQVARPAHIPMITYSNDVGVAARDVFVLGSAPAESVQRVVSYAKGAGVRRVAGLIPNGTYGQRTSAALVATARELGMAVGAMESYDRGNTSIISAARRLGSNYDGVLVAEGGRLSLQAAPQLSRRAHVLGTSLWAGDAALTRSPALRGAWFAALSDSRWPRFEASYKTRFGGLPPRLATMGYDSVLLTINVARGWRPGTTFPTAKLYDAGGFIGLDGAFRFRDDGVAERAMEVREIGAGSTRVVSPAPARFTDGG